MVTQKRRARIAAVVVLRAALMLSTSTVASAETFQERQACIGDAFHFCSGAIPDRDRVFACLLQNRDVISAACRAVVAPDVPVEQALSQKLVPRNAMTVPHLKWSN